MDVPFLTYWYFFGRVIVVTLIHSWTLCHGDWTRIHFLSPIKTSPWSDTATDTGDGQLTG